MTDRILRIATFLLLASAALRAQGWNTDLVYAQAGTQLTACTATAAAAVASAAVLPGGGWGIALDGQRNVWVANWSSGQNTVSKFAPDGALIGSFVAGPPAAPGESPVGPLAIDAAGFVYVGDPRDTVTGSVTKLDPQGNVVLTFGTGGSSVRALAVDADGNLWILVYWGTGFHVEKRTPSGAFLLGLAPGAIIPNGLFLDERGRVWISHHPGPDQIAIHDLNGNSLGTVTSGYGNHLRSVGVAPDGKIWANGSYTVEVFAASGQSLANLYGGIGFVSSIAFDGRGQTWINFYQNWIATNPTTRIRMRRYDGTPAFLNEFVAGPPSPNGTSFNIGDPTGMVRARTVDPYGNLDGDGHPNLVEVLAGESPLDPVSVPATHAFLTPPAIGTTLRIAIAATGDGPRPYFMPWSLNPDALDLAAFTGGADRRAFPISPFVSGAFPALDPLWVLATGGSPFSAAVFPDTFGVLDAAGQATVRVHIPNLPSLAGATFHAAFATLDTMSPSGLRTISARIPVSIP